MIGSRRESEVMKTVFSLKLNIVQPFQSGLRKKSKGGIFFNLLKDMIPSEQYYYIFEEYKKNEKEKMQFKVVVECLYSYFDII